MDLLVDIVSDGTLYLLSLPTYSLISAAVVLVLLTYWPVWDRSKYPPAPIPLPFFGDGLLMLKHWQNPGRYFYENRHKYSEVFTLRLNVPTVFLNSPEAIHEGFVKKANSLSSRAPADIYSPELVVLGHENALGMIDSPDGVWQPLRRHMLTVFREHGVGKQGMEEVITTETRFFLEALEKTNGDPIDVQDQLTQSISNVATHIIFGRRFDYDAEQLNNLQMADFSGTYLAIVMMPFLQYLPFDLLGYEASKKKIRAGIDFCVSQIAEHKADLDPDNPRDLVDSFLIEMSKVESDNQAFTDANLLGLVVQLYVAGTDTTSNSLYWAFLFMILYPDVQEKVADEIRNVIGERSAVSSDRDKMPYTMSTMTEVLRADVAIMSLGHFTSEETVVRGHTIPKGTAVFGNLWTTTHNEDLYKDPHKFKADRFLDQEGNFVKPDVKDFMAFSIGRRVCPGEQLARTELFLFLVSTLQKFRIECGQDTTPSTDGVANLVLEPPKYKVKFIPRSV